MAGLARLRMLLFMGWRNIWRSPWRSLLTIAAIAGSLMMVILYSALLEGMSRQMVTYATDISTGHLQLHREAFSKDRDLYATIPWDYQQRIESAFPVLHVAPRLYAAGLASSAQTSTGVMIRAIDPDRERHVTRMLEHVRAGTAELMQQNGQASVLIGAQLAKNMHLTVGAELVLVTQAADGSIGNGLFHIEGILKPLEPNFDRMGILMSIPAWQDLMALQEGFHELAIHLDDATQLESVQAALDQRLHEWTQAQPLDELGGPLLLRNWKQLAPTVADMLQLSQGMVLVVGVIIVALASLGLLNTLLMSIHERQHEFGILLSIGMKSRWLVLMVLLESLLLALVSALAGTVLGLAIYAWFADTGIDFSSYMPDGYDWAGMTFAPVMELYLQPVHVLRACVLMLIVTLLAALIPSWRMARLRPLEVLR